jgi:hypothetical protein
MPELSVGDIGTVDGRACIVVEVPEAKHMRLVVKVEFEEKPGSWSKSRGYVLRSQFRSNNGQDFLE